MCALALIVKPGYYTQSKEVLPILSFEGSMLAKCIEIHNNIQYGDLNANDFENSFPFIKDVASLKDYIVKRYGLTLPDVSRRRLISLGVAMTKLIIIQCDFKISLPS